MLLHLQPSSTFYSKITESSMPSPSFTASITPSSSDMPGGSGDNGTMRGMNATYFCLMTIHDCMLIKHMSFMLPT